MKNTVQSFLRTDKYPKTRIMATVGVRNFMDLEPLLDEGASILRLKSARFTEDCSFDFEDPLTGHVPEKGHSCVVDWDQERGESRLGASGFTVGTSLLGGSLGAPESRRMRILSACGPGVRRADGVSSMGRDDARDV